MLFVYKSLLHLLQDSFYLYIILNDGNSRRDKNSKELLSVLFFFFNI